jgi:tRNA modification GTPase
MLERIAGVLPPPRFCRLAVFRRPVDGSVIDQGLTIWFPGPASFTGEDVAEFHCHGGRAVVDALFRTMEALGARMAAPGEFTRRAFDNGKLDLTQAEGLADLIAAETEAQQRQAVSVAQGALAKQAEVWRGSLISLRAEIEAQLDFADEGDVPDALTPGFWSRVAALRADMAEALETAAAGERVRDGFRVAILGRPNAGKSTLLNALARRDLAIVTDEPGTTRDVLEVHLDLGGYPVILLDTAGLRDADTAAEREGVRRAEASAAGADLVLWLEDSTTQPAAIPVQCYAPVWRVRTKGDAEGATAADAILISAVTGEGLSALSCHLEVFARELGGREAAVVTRARQRDALDSAVQALRSPESFAPEITADLLRSAGEAIGRLTGRIDVEDVLDRLFSDFCIGK